MSNATTRGLRRNLPRRVRVKRFAGALGLSAATLAISVVAFVPALAQEAPQTEPTADATESVEQSSGPPAAPPAEPPATPPVETPQAGGTVVVPPGDETPFVPVDETLDPASGYRVRFDACTYDEAADESTCTWQVTDSSGAISGPGGVSHVALGTCLGPDAAPLPADNDNLIGSVTWDATYAAPDTALDPNQPALNAWTWDLSDGLIPVGTELSLVKQGEIPSTGTTSYALKNVDEYRDSVAGPSCASSVSSRGRSAPIALAAPGDNLSVTIRKQTTPNGSLQQFSFVLQKCNIADTNACNANPANWVTVSNGTQSIPDNGVFTWGNDNTAPGTFVFGNVARWRVLETTPFGWAFVNLSPCTTGLQSFNTITSGNQAGASFRFTDANNQRFFDCTWNNAQAQNGTLRIHKGGDRAGVGGAINPLNGATFQVATDANFTNIVGSCTTGPPNPPNTAGQCDVALPAGTYFVRENTSPNPFFPIPQLAIGPGGQANPPVDYEFQVTVTAGNTTQVPPNESGYQRKFANRRNNPPFPSQCGIKIALVFDRSNSISGAELQDMKDAGTSFTSALGSTPSEVGVYSFGSTATTNLGLTSVSTPAGVTTVNNAINGLTTGGGSTNWDDAFQEVAGDGAQVVLLLTDGNPTISNVGGNGSTTTFWEIEEGVASANLVKSQNTKVVGLGIGSDVSVTNLQAISGPVLNDDYFVSDFSDLQDTLVAIATELCGANVNVTKLLDGQPSANWVFTPTTQTAGITFSPTPTGSTGANGMVDFDVNAIPANGGTITLTETVKPGTTFVSASCTSDGQPIGTQGASSIQFPVNRQDDISCVFNNTTSSAQFTVLKDFVPNSAASVSVTLSCASGTVSPPGAQNVSEATPGVWTVTGFTGNPNCTATENPIPPGYTSTGTCTAGLVTPGQCTITNTLNTAQFQVFKDFVPNSAASVSVTLSCASGAVSPAGAQNVSEATPGVWTVSGFTGDPNCIATENPIPAGYDSTGTCSAALSAGECTIVNTLRTAQFQVFKDFQPNNPNPVSVTLSCASGAVSPAGAQNVSEATPGVWTVTGFTGNPNCTATENPIPAGYDSTGTCSAALVEVGECTITNTLLPASISITKTAAPPVVNPGGNVTYTLLVVNDGDIGLANVVVTDHLPAELNPVSADPSKGSCVVAQTIICNIGNLAIDEEVTIGIVARVKVNTPADTMIHNVASVTGDPPVGPPVEDEDDADVEVTQVSPTTVVPTTRPPGPRPAPVPRAVSGTLPFTGSHTAMLLKAAAWLLVLGGLLVFAVRRRRARAASELA